MQLTEQAIIEFQRMYETEYGHALNREQAIGYGLKLIDFVRIVYGRRVFKSLDALKQNRYDEQGHN